MAQATNASWLQERMAGRLQLREVELLDVDGGIAGDEHRTAEDALEFFEVLVAVRFEHLGHFGMDAEDDGLVVDGLRNFLGFQKKFSLNLRMFVGLSLIPSELRQPLRK